MITQKYNTLEYCLNTIGELLPIVVMTMTFVPLIVNLKRYHHFEYQRTRKNIIAFYLGEIIVFVLTYIYVSIGIGISPELFKVQGILYLVGLYPF